MDDTYTPAQVGSWFGLNVVTMRKWLNFGDNPLKVDGDSAEGSRWRRFSFADLVRFQLMDTLSIGLDINTRESISLVNQLFERVAGWAAFATEEAKVQGTWAAVEPFWVVVTRRSMGATACIEFPKTIGGLTDALNHSQVDGAIVFNLTEIVRRAVLKTERVWVEPAAAEGDI